MAAASADDSSKDDEGLVERGISNPGGRMEANTLAFISGIKTALGSCSPCCCCCCLGITAAGGGMEDFVDP